jgi:uncharacterized repeat protein (TIGR03803 family)
MNTDGTGFTTLYNFTGGSDGLHPRGLLALDGNTLYGTTPHWGIGNNGTVYKVNTDGTGFTTLYTFTSPSTSPPWTNSDGADPASGLILSGRSLYGTASVGGAAGYGTIFKLNTDGTGFTVLHNFALTDNDAYDAQWALTLDGNALYGTTTGNGSTDNGTMFRLNTDGTGYTILHSFAGPPNDGAYPQAQVLLIGNTVYGTTYAGGTLGGGTVFSLSLPATGPQLTITPAGGNVILSWLTNATRFTLQSTANLSAAIWTTNLPAPAVINGQNTVTNPISGTQQFYRLSQ